MNPAADSSLTMQQPAKTWIKVTLLVTPEMADAAAVFLVNLTDGGVETVSLHDKAGLQSRTEQIIAYLTSEEHEHPQVKIAQLQEFLSNLQKYFPSSAQPSLFIEEIREEDWGSVWKQYFTTFQVTPRIVIKPSWESYNSDEQETVPGQIVIEMDPGMAFGTGHHASTRLALTLIEDIFFSQNSAPKSVLDVGAGTGILAVCCALFGSQEVLAIDNDHVAVTVAQDNVVRNGVEAIVTVSGRELAELTGQFDLISANITHDILIDMASALEGLLCSGGRLILAGVLRGEQEKSIISAYTCREFALSKIKSREEWAAMDFKKR